MDHDLHTWLHFGVSHVIAEAMSSRKRSVAEFIRLFPRHKIAPFNYPDLTLHGMLKWSASVENSKRSLAMMEEVH